MTNPHPLAEVEAPPGQALHRQTIEAKEQIRILASRRQELADGVMTIMRLLASDVDDPAPYGIPPDMIA